MSSCSPGDVPPPAAQVDAHVHLPLDVQDAIGQPVPDLLLDEVELGGVLRGGGPLPLEQLGPPVEHVHHALVAHLEERGRAVEEADGVLLLLLLLLSPPPGRGAAAATPPGGPRAGPQGYQQHGFPR